MYIGHKREDGFVQPLSEHLSGVSEMADRFAEVFGAKQHGRRTGILHDAGKYSPAGQRRMENPEHTAKVDHSTAGAIIAFKTCHDIFGALAIAGHHGGIPDCGSRLSMEGEGTLRGRIQKKLSGNMDYSAFWHENQIDSSPLFPIWLSRSRSFFEMQFYTRMLFSCLVDADYLDTERFMRGRFDLRGNHDELERLYERLSNFVAPWLNNPKGIINEKRSDILRNCLDMGEKDRGLFSLTVPTGGGKTVSSLAFALKHAIKNGLERIIYVIPYTSIIEQNADVFSAILGKYNVIEHHSGSDYNSDEDQENTLDMRRLLASENWDAPVIVTTAVQFFESLYSNKPSRCRKLHNIANSVIVFDEAQMLPLSCLRPCVAGMAELVKHFKASVVLCTATQPSLEKLFAEYIPEFAVREICADVPEMQKIFRRVHYENAGTIKLNGLVDQLAQRKQVLCIVNARKTAQTVFQALPEEGRYHLSTRMTPEHRSKVLNAIREKLKMGEDCHVVSTSLIEAGVDIDFPEVWREMAGLDSILQAGGRCNREGRRQAKDSAVVIFSTAEATPKGMQPNVAAAKMALESAIHPDDRVTIQEYFDQLYWMRGDEALDANGIISMCNEKNMMHKTISDTFRMIDSETKTIFIPTIDNAEDLDQLRRGLINRELMRRLGRSAVNVYSWDWNVLDESGLLECIDEDWAILADLSAYDPECGLKVDIKPGQGLWT